LKIEEEKPNPIGVAGTRWKGELAGTKKLVEKTTKKRTYSHDKENLDERRGAGEWNLRLYRINSQNLEHKLVQKRRQEEGKECSAVVYKERK